MKNLDIPDEARQLMEIASEADHERITVIERDQFMAVKFAGIVACRPIQHQNEKATWLRLTNIFGQTEFAPKPDGRFLDERVISAVSRIRARVATPEVPTRAIKSIDVSTGQAAWLFLDGDIDKPELEDAEDVLKEWSRSLFHHGTSDTIWYSERLGWKLKVDWGINPVEAGIESPDLNILLGRRNDQIPDVNLGT